MLGSIVSMRKIRNEQIKFEKRILAMFEGLSVIVQNDYETKIREYNDHLIEKLASSLRDQGDWLGNALQTSDSLKLFLRSLIGEVQNVNIDNRLFETLLNKQLLKEVTNEETNETEIISNCATLEHTHETTEDSIIDILVSKGLLKEVTNEDTNETEIISNCATLEHTHIVNDMTQEEIDNVKRIPDRIHNNNSFSVVLKTSANPTDPTLPTQNHIIDSNSSIESIFNITSIEKLIT